MVGTVGVWVTAPISDPLNRGPEAWTSSSYHTLLRQLSLAIRVAREVA